MKEKPGIMVYFDLRLLLERLSNEEAGILFRAMMDYGAEGIPPKLPDSLYLVWPLIQMHLDTDDRRYQEVTSKRKYAIYVRWAKERGEEPLNYNAWLSDTDAFTPDITPDIVS